jgi:hypothetical protein
VDLVKHFRPNDFGTYRSARRTRLLLSESTAIKKSSRRGGFPALPGVKVLPPYG